MAKLLVFATIMVAVLALTQASRFTISTTVDGDDDNQVGQSRKWKCQQQIREQYSQIASCQAYLYGQGYSGRSLEMGMTIERKAQKGLQEGEQQRRLKGCCEVLRNFDDECRCEGVKFVFQKVQEESPRKLGQQDVERIRQAARYLPLMCGGMGRRGCDI